MSRTAVGLVVGLLVSGMSSGELFAQRGRSGGSKPDGPAGSVPVKWDGKSPGGQGLKAEETARKFDLSWAIKQLPPLPAGSTADPLASLLDESAMAPEGRTVRPTIVWFAPGEPDAALEKQLFGSDDLRIAAMYFNCVKIIITDVEPKELLHRYTKGTTAFVFFDAGAKETGRLGNPGGPQPIVAQMNKASQAHFKKPLSELITKYNEFLKRFDAFAARVWELGQVQLAAEKNDSAQRTEKTKTELKRALDAIEATQKERAKFEAEERALLKLELKSDPYAPPAKAPGKG